MSKLNEIKKKNMPLARKALRSFAGESGATFVEYAMLAGLVAIVVAVAVALFGSKLKSLFTSVSEKVEDVDTAVKGSDVKPPNSGGETK